MNNSFENMMKKAKISAAKGYFSTARNYYEKAYNAADDTMDKAAASDMMLRTEAIIRKAAVDII